MCYLMPKTRHWIRTYTSSKIRSRRSQKILTELLKRNWKSKRLNTLLKKDSGNMKYRPKAQEQQTEARAYCSEHDCCCGTKPGSPDTNTCQIFRETGLTYSSIVWIIRCDVCLKCIFHLPKRTFAIIVSFFYIYFTKVL